MLRRFFLTRDFAIASLLAVAVTLIYVQTVRHQFINLDDGAYVFTNPHLHDGLTPSAVAWAFTAFYSDNWHPLTWLSHALDIQCYGLWAPGHHFTALILQLAVTLALYFLLKRLMGSTWPAALATAIFALHPLRVESVAWVAERKDVLSGLFFMLTLHAWLSYVRRPSKTAYAAVLALYVLGLLCKPMLVTLPVVLMLLDYWPLRRVAGGGWRVEGDAKQTPVTNKRKQPRHASNLTLLKNNPSPSTHHPSLSTLIVEKLPLFALAVASSACTLVAQYGGIETIGSLPISVRIENALVTTAAYLGQSLWPTHLSIYYSLSHDGPPFEQVLAAILILATISAIAIALRRTRPYLIVGWLWYIVMLVPVIGLVQVGGQSGADRYTYLPLIGPVMAVVVALTSGWKSVARGGSAPRLPTVGSRAILSIAASLALACLSAAAWEQTSYWFDSLKLWQHALAVRPVNETTLNLYAMALLDAKEAKDDDKAFEVLNRAVKMAPNRASIHANLGEVFLRRNLLKEAITEFRMALNAFHRQASVHSRFAQALERDKQFDEAAREYDEALKLDPQLADAHKGKGGLLARRGQVDVALLHFQAAAARDPSAENLVNLANALMQLGRNSAAVDAYLQALAQNPGLVEARYHLALALDHVNRRGEALDQLRLAINTDPSYAPAYNALGALLVDAGKLRDAATLFLKVVELDPKNCAARINLGRTFDRLGHHAEAIEQLRIAVRIDPQQPQCAAWLAWSLATAPDGDLRRGYEALALAERAVTATQGRDPTSLDALAAAQAEVNQFPAAARTAKQAQQVALSLGNSRLAAEIAQRLELYKAGKPFRVQ